MSSNDTVQVRIEPETRRKAEEILKRFGLTHSELINMAYRAVVESGEIPFSLHVPNRETAQALQEARDPQARGRWRRHESVEALMKDLMDDEDA